MSARSPRPWATVFRVPVILAGLTLLGLFAALLGEAALWRWTAWLALGVPVVVIVWKLRAALVRMRARTVHE